MGLVLKLRNHQRIQIDSVSIEVSLERGQIKLHFEGPNPFPFRLVKEKKEDFDHRMRGKCEDKIHRVHTNKFKKDSK